MSEEQFRGEMIRLGCSPIYLNKIVESVSAAHLQRVALTECGEEISLEEAESYASIKRARFAERIVLIESGALVWDEETDTYIKRSDF